MKLLQLLFLIFIIYLVCVFLFEVSYNGMMYRKVDGIVTESQENGKRISVNYAYNGVGYTTGRFTVSTGSYKVGDIFPIRINPLFPRNFTNGNEPMIDVLGMIFMTVAIVMIVGIYFLYRAIYGIEKGNWFVNSEETLANKLF